MTVGTSVFASPFNAPKMMVYDTETEQLSDVSTEALHSGSAKWDGITVLGSKVYAIPFDAPCILTYDVLEENLGCVSTRLYTTSEPEVSSRFILSSREFSLAESDVTLAPRDPEFFISKKYTESHATLAVF